MKIATGATTQTEVENVLGVLEDLISELNSPPDLLIIYYSEGYDIAGLTARIRTRLPDTAMHGGTSCTGAMTEKGVASHADQGIALLGISDPSGSYGVGSADIGNDPVKAAESALNGALEQANCPGEVPAMVWLTAAPGHEESIIRGIANILGNDVPVAGGSSGDNSVSGNWKQFTREDVCTDSVVVTVLFPSTEILFAFHSGYEPTGTKGVITRAGGYMATGSKGIATEASRRVLTEIDGSPAAEVYNAWTNGKISDQIRAGGGNILQQSTLHPLGRVAGYIGEIPYYQLSHPDSVTADGAMTLFSDICKGDEIVMMQGTTDSLISRAGRVALSTLETNMTAPEDIAGAVVVYCAGCMLAVRDRLDEVVESFRAALPGVPFSRNLHLRGAGMFPQRGKPPRKPDDLSTSIVKGLRSFLSTAFLLQGASW